MAVFSPCFLAYKLVEYPGGMRCSSLTDSEGKKTIMCPLSDCKKGGFVALRHDGVRNLLTSLIGKVCTNVEVEPQLQPLDNERFNLRSAVTSPEARLDFKGGGFWSRGVTALFDVRVTHVNSKCNQGKATSTISKEQEEEKKRKYQERVLEVEIGSFTSLVSGTNGGMGADCNCFLKRLAEKLSEKNEEPYHNNIILGLEHCFLLRF